MHHTINIGRSWLVGLRQPVLKECWASTLLLQTINPHHGIRRGYPIMHAWCCWLVDQQPFSSSFQSGRKPHGWNTTRQVRSRGFSFLVPSILTQSGWMMRRILLKSIVDNTSRTGKKRTSNLLSSHCPAKQDKQHGKHWTTCLIVRERAIC